MKEAKARMFRILDHPSSDFYAYFAYFAVKPFFVL